MDLDEFKGFWQLDQEKDLQAQKHTSHHINAILMKTNVTLGKLEKTNKFWLRFMLVLLPAALFFLIMANVRTEGSANPPDPSFQQSLLFQMIVVGFVFLTTFFYYWQYKIFHFSPTVDLKTGLRAAIRGFYTFYAVSSVLYTPCFFLIFFVIAQPMSRSFTYSLGFTANLWLAGLGTVLAHVGNYWYYRRTYFQWVKSLKQNLKELEGS